MRRTRLIGIAALLTAVGAHWAFAQGHIVETFAGGGPDGDPTAGIPVMATSIAVDPSGTIYVGSRTAQSIGLIHAIDPNGHMTLLAGSPLSNEVEGGPARDRYIGMPYGMVLDGAGNLLFSEFNYTQVRRLDLSTGIVSVLAGGGSSMADGIPATEAYVGTTLGLALDGAGNLYIVSGSRQKILRVDAATGILTTVAGTGVTGFSGDGGPATSAMLNYPMDVVVDPSGSLYISDQGNFRVRKVDGTTGVITTFAGTGTEGDQGDGGPATSANLENPWGLALNAAGDLFITTFYQDADGGCCGRVRVVDAATGIISLYAGSGYGTGENIPATSLSLREPVGIGFDAAGDLLVAEQGSSLTLDPVWWGRLYRVDATTGLVSSVTGRSDWAGDGGLATDALLQRVAGLTYDASGNLFVTDSNWIRRVDAATGVITRVAGTDPAGPYVGDGGPALQEWLDDPQGTAIDAAGNLFIAETWNHKIRWVDASTGIIDTYAGNGSTGFSGDNGPATSASLWFPKDVAFDLNGDLCIADTYNNRIRKVITQTGQIVTVAGDGNGTFAGDGGPATTASLWDPASVAFDAAGNLFIADTQNYRIRRVDAGTGIITTVAGDGTLGYGGDGGPATSAHFGTIGSLAVDGNGNLLLADGTNRVVRKVDMGTGIIETVAGGGAYRGDGNEPLQTLLEGTLGIAADGAGGFVVGAGRRVRSILPTSAPTDAGRIPGGDPNSFTPLTATLAPYGMLTLSWGASCHSSDTDFDIYEGNLGDFTSHAPLTCGVANATSFTFAPAPGSSYYLVVPRSYAREGSYGFDGAGIERPPSLTACRAQAIATCL